MDNNNEHRQQWSKASEDILQTRYPLHKACREGDIENLALLLVSSAQQHSALVEDEFYGWTPAHWAAYFGKVGCMCEVLIIATKC